MLRYLEQCCQLKLLTLKVQLVEAVMEFFVRVFIVTCCVYIKFFEMFFYHYAANFCLFATILFFSRDSVANVYRMLFLDLFVYRFYCFLFCVEFFVGFRALLLYLLYLCSLHFCMILDFAQDCIELWV